MDHKFYLAPDLSISNVTENGFKITIIPLNDGYEKPRNYDLEIMNKTPDAGKWVTLDKNGLTEKDFPFNFKDVVTGQEYTVYLTAHFNGTEHTEINIADARTTFVPITSVSVKENVKRIEIHLPRDESAIFRDLNDSNLIISPQNASNSNAADGGTRKVFNREIVDKSVADVDYRGNVVGKKRGITTLVTSAKDARDKFSAIKTEIEVIQNATEIQTDLPYVKIKKGERRNLNVTILPIDTNNKEVTYKSGNPEIANVDANTGLVTARNIGLSTITATSVDNPSKKVYITVEVASQMESIWYNISSIGRFLNSGDFNMLQSDLEYVYTLAKQKMPSIAEMTFPKVINTIDFFATRRVIDNFFSNVYLLSKSGIVGFEPIRDIKAEYNAMEVAPNNKMWNDALASIKQMKGVLENGK